MYCVVKTFNMCLGWVYTVPCISHECRVYAWADKTIKLWNCSHYGFHMLSYFTSTPEWIRCAFFCLFIFFHFFFLSLFIIDRWNGKHIEILVFFYFNSLLEFFSFLSFFCWFRVRVFFLTWYHSFNFFLYSVHAKYIYILKDAIKHVSIEYIIDKDQALRKKWSAKNRTVCNVW